MENSTKKFRILVKRLRVKPQGETASVAHVDEAGTSTNKRSRRSALSEEHKQAVIDFEKEHHVLLLKLKASHTLWHEVSSKLNSIKSEKGNRDTPQWRASILNWRKRVMAKKTDMENLSPVDTAAKKHWEQPC
ncbi:hypothetical protein KR038_001592 [Drosophila bunnanda]|nr:hypothetical protein KR038_001592 [Drosophila bunnanda]